ncbi:MAG TPA: DUF5666 domain-containing protein [Thermoflexus sp.]|nr:DUF5666 domain-containing protein [Thermoflexus sp.]
MKTRRQFLQAMSVGLAVGLGFLYPGLQRWLGMLVKHESRFSSTGSRATVYRLEELDPTYAAGEVIEKLPEGVILKSDLGLRAVRIPPDTKVWKEFETTPEVIQLHDWLDVKGTPLPDGTLLAHSGWVFVNIARRDGKIREWSSEGLVLEHNKGLEAIELSPRLEVIRASDGQPIPEGPAALRPGMIIGAVGLRLPDGRFRATRIWIP